jgi:hypothetical protein
LNNLELAESEVDDLDIDEDEFDDRVQNLESKLGESCEENEEHAGITILAILKVLATNINDMILANDLDPNDVMKQIHQDLDKIMDNVRSSEVDRLH